MQHATNASVATECVRTKELTTPAIAIAISLRVNHEARAVIRRRCEQLPMVAILIRVLSRVGAAIAAGQLQSGRPQAGSTSEAPLVPERDRHQPPCGRYEQSSDPGDDQSGTGAEDL